MDERPDTGRHVSPVIFAVALGLGLLGEFMLLHGRLGVNVFLCLLTFLLGAAWLAGRQGITLTGEGLRLVPAALFFAFSLAWWDAPLLAVMDVLVLVFTIFLLVPQMQATEKPRRTGVTDMVMAAVHGGVQVLFGPFLLLGTDTRWQALTTRRWAGTLAAVARGLLLAIPLLLVFAVLLMQADPVFSRLLSNVFAVEFANLWDHLVGTVFFAWLGAGALRAALVAPYRDDILWSPAPEKYPRLGTIETVVVLGLLNALFLAFVLIQFRYLFGGSDLVLSTAGLTYADYARRGFFELVAVAVLALPTLLVGHWLISNHASEDPGDEPSTERIFRVLAGATVVLLGVILASALFRMWVYQDAYGLTELRLYVTAFVIWLGALLALFVVTVLRRQRRRFAWGALVAGHVVLISLHLANPGALIAQVNLSRIEATGRFDAYYATSLSASAVPALIDALPNLPPEQQKILATNLLEKWGQGVGEDWRSWNRARAHARFLVQHHAGELKAEAGPDT